MSVAILDLSNLRLRCFEARLHSLGGKIYFCFTITPRCRPLTSQQEIKLFIWIMLHSLGSPNFIFFLALSSRNLLNLYIQLLSFLDAWSIRIWGDKKRKRFNLFGNWDFVTLGLVSTFVSLYSFPWERWGHNKFLYIPGTVLCTLRSWCLQNEENMPQQLESFKEW